ncbi:hypothetical protein GCM10007857_07420 [Bradyrhizobium iriomotense]|uniref:Uncharacterized protein n=1 Tax=Bradyrhizobium iriomotense TaxID=441950 RepID=A0ABQ6AVX0_9BRAD|nr:hypothetical protein GCM10007857_07420 [Bradyrhizobium iriomotense]
MAEKPPVVAVKVTDRPGWDAKQSLGQSLGAPGRGARRLSERPERCEPDVEATAKRHPGAGFRLAVPRNGPSSSCRGLAKKDNVFAEDLTAAAP